MPPQPSAETVQRISLKNREYAHVEDANRGVVLTEIGPKVLTLDAHQSLVKKDKMVELGVGRYCVVRNPVERVDGRVVLDDFGQARLAVGDREVRVGPLAFPLYPGEELEGKVEAEKVLGVYDALKLRALMPFEDTVNGQPRQREAGDEWLVRGPGRYIPRKEVQVVSEQKALMLRETEYCVVLNPIDRATGRIQEGRRRVIAGPEVVFLEPGEALEGDVRQKHVLTDRDGLKLRALDHFTETRRDGTKVERRAGDMWIIRGPQTYVPPEQVEILEEITVRSLGQGEGLYVRDLRTGKVELVEGPCQFWPEAYQELHEKRLSPDAEALLGLADADRTRAIVLRVEDNFAVLINDFENNTARTVVGPAKVMLKPYEDVAVLELSGGTPKRPRQIKAIFLHLGPDFSTDLFEVATRDHARLRIKLSYKWQFELSGNPEKDKAIFRVNDFVGYVCENLASRIRQVAAENDFESFHKGASTLIRRAVFGLDADGKPRKERLFAENQLRIIDIDIKDISPVDEKTAQKLHEAIDTNIQIQLDASRQEAQAQAELKRIKSEEEKQLADIESRKKAEDQRQELIELENRNRQLSQIGEAKTEAEAVRERSRIESETVLAQAEAEARALQIRTEAEVERQRKLMELELQRQRQLAELEVAKARRLAEVDAATFKERVAAMEGGENFVRAVAAQAQAAAVGGIEKVVFVPSGSGLNLFSSMQDLLGGLTPQKKAAEVAEPKKEGDS